jgi:DNA-binding response OmpR family regulator
VTAKEKSMPLPAPPHAARILIAEDDPVQAAIIRALLEQEGYRVEARPTLAGARDAIRAEPPDLVLLDRMLPDGDGCVLCQELKENPVTQGLPVLLLTMRDTVAERVEGLLRGADDYIAKPFHPTELLARVHSALRMLALQRELAEKAGELARKHAELQDAQARLVRSERLAAIGEIGLAIRHEINNPLSAILGFTDLLLGQTADEARTKLEAIKRCSLRIRDVVRRLEHLDDDRTVEYVEGIQMTDLGASSPAAQP